MAPRPPRRPRSTPRPHRQATAPVRQNQTPTPADAKTTPANPHLKHAHARHNTPNPKLLPTPGGSIGTPLDNAIGYRCWHVAHRLVERGAHVDKLWHAAALGLMTRLEQLIAAEPDPAQVNEAFWQACHGGQRRAAEHLLRHGADINTTVEYAHGTALDVAPGPDTRRDLLTTWLREQGAQPSQRPS